MLALLRFLTPLNGVLGDLKDAYIAKQAAKNDRERIHAEQRIARLEARKQVLLRSSPTSSIVQAAWAAPFIIYNAKIIVWDKVLGWGVTDPLGPFETNIGYMVVGFYFLSISGRSLIGR